MAKLTATRSVLYQNRLYQPGDELPQSDRAMVDAWVEAGSAEMEAEEAAELPAAPEPEEKPQQKKKTGK